ncbi:MAG: DUF4156 domain-containing protein [Mariprofundaceae bacterium]
MKRHWLILLFALIWIFSACTWVKPTSDGDQVRVLGATQVSSCKKVGKTTVSVLDKIGFVSRSEETVGEELATLARNSGGNMGGDTVVAVSGIKDGEQSFDVYTCMKP